MHFQWKGLSVDQRAKYEELARKDKERYESECVVRDKCALQRQEERRKTHSAQETDTRMRGTTVWQPTPVIVCDLLLLTHL